MSVGWLATILGFAVTIAAILLLYRIAYEGVVQVVKDTLGGPQLDQMIQLVISMLLLVVSIALGQWFGRKARDWINAGRRAPRRGAAAPRA